MSSDVAGLEVLFALVEMLSGLSLALGLTVYIGLHELGRLDLHSLFATECVPNPVQAFSQSSPLP